MRTTLKHGAVLETATPKEIRELLKGMASRDTAKRVRATAIVVLDVAGAGQDEVYTVPAGFQFEARRVFFDLDTAADPATGNVPLNVAGKTVEYLRSGQRVEYAAPYGPNQVPQVPGTQTWGDQQGPYFRNNETVEVRVKGFPAGSRLTVALEGILSRPGPEGQ